MTERNIGSWISQPPAETGHRSIAERFGIPHDFPPQLTLPQACVRVIAVLVRILVGSLWFALCGFWAMRAWAAIPNAFERAATMILLALLFIVPLAAMLVGISAAVEAISPERR